MLRKLGRFLSQMDDEHDNPCPKAVVEREVDSGLGTHGAVAVRGQGVRDLRVERH